jgi:hypothetical protein
MTAYAELDSGRNTQPPWMRCRRASRCRAHLRLWVEGTDRFEVWERVTELQRLASLFAPAGVDVRYVQLRPNRSRRFEATMEPAKRKRAP